MRKLFWALFIGSLNVLLAACGGRQADSPVPTDNTVLVEIISLDHAPIRPAVQEALGVTAEFGDKVVVQSYHFGTLDGAAFAEAHDLTEHTPIAIFVNGEMAIEVDGRTVKFFSFPQGEGTGMVAEGVWTMADLRAALEQEMN